MTAPVHQYSNEERRKRIFAIVGASSGNLVEWFDFYVYAFCAIYFAPAFFPSDNPTVQLLNTAGVFAAGFLMRPIGGWMFGRIADKHGRKTAMLISVVMMCAGSLAIACMPTYASIGTLAPALLLLARMFQGLSVGGEYGTSATYMSEVALKGQRGFFASFQYVTLIGGQLLAVLVVVILQQLLSEDELRAWGWRIPFAAGLLVLPIGLYIRLNLAETFSGRGRQASTRNLLGELFGNHRRALLLGLLILSGSTITQYFLNYMTTFALTELHLPAGIAMLSTLVAGAALALSALLGGVLCDRYGRRAVLILPRLALLAVLFPALQAMTRHPEPAVFLAVLALLSALHGMSGAALIVLLVESFPRALRSTGFSLVYATGVAAFGGTAQIVVTWLIGVTGNPLSPLGYLLLANLVCLVGAWLARETWPGRGDMGGAPLVLRD
ncbi:MAG: MFS transporter [Pseudomonas aeruginosa]|nr:MFS transporter [Pseudomonas aeruginosa]